MLKKILFFLVFFPVSCIFTMDPTLPRTAHHELAQRFQGRPDSNHIILQDSFAKLAGRSRSLGVAGAPDEQRQMEGQQVTIQTSDAKKLQVSVPLAKQSIMIKNLIEDAGIDNPIPLPNIESSVWTKIQQLLPHVQTNNTKVIEDAFKAFDGPPLLAFIAAANYLDIPILLKASIEIAKRIDVKNIAPEQIVALPKQIRGPIFMAQMERMLGPKMLQELGVLKGHAEGVYSVCVTPDGSKIASGAYDNTIRIWDLESHKELAVLQGHAGDVCSVCVTPDGSKIVSGSFDETIGIWDLESYKELAVLKEHVARVSSACVTPDSSKIVSGSYDKTIRIWDLESHKKLAVLKGYIGIIESVCVTSDGSKIVSGDRDAKIRIWDLESHKELAVLQGHTGDVCSVCVTPDGSKIVSGSCDKTIRIWDLESRKELAVLKGHVGYPHSVCVTADGSKIVSGYSNDTIRIWDLESHKELAVLQGHTGNIYSVCLTPDGSKIISGSWDNTIRIWGDIFVLDIQEEDFINMNAKQAQKAWRYLQQGHAQGWLGIKDFFK